MKIIPIIQQEVVGTVLKSKPIGRYPGHIIHICPEGLQPLPVGDKCVPCSVLLFGDKIIAK